MRCLYNMLFYTQEESAVSLALKLNGKKVGLREIRVQISTSKPKEKTTIKRKHEKSKDEGESY